MKRLFILAAAFGLLLIAGASADAGIFGGHRPRLMSRCLGLGWSDGYHAACCGDYGSWCGGHCGWRHGCGQPACAAPCCGKMKVVSPSAFGSGARIVPEFSNEPMPAY